MCVCQYEDPHGNDKRMCPEHGREVVVSSSVPRVHGFNSRDHKMAGDLQICSKEAAEKYYKLTARTGGIVSNGMRHRS
jgi:hypothetical protein